MELTVQRRLLSSFLPCLSLDTARGFCCPHEQSQELPPLCCQADAARPVASLHPAGESWCSSGCVRWARGRAEGRQSWLLCLLRSRRPPPSRQLCSPGVARGPACRWVAFPPRFVTTLFCSASKSMAEIWSLLNWNKRASFFGRYFRIPPPPCRQCFHKAEG